MDPEDRANALIRHFYLSRHIDWPLIRDKAANANLVEAASIAVCLPQLGELVRGPDRLLEVMATIEGRLKEHGQPLTHRGAVIKLAEAKAMLEAMHDHS